MISFLSRFLSPAVRSALRHRVGAPDVEWSLRNLRRNGFQPLSIVDVGAYKGEWATLARQVFPEASVLMVEPQAERAGGLERLASASEGRLRFAPALLGAEDVERRPFYVNGTVSSALPEHHATDARTVEMPMRRLDTVLAETGFPAPNLVKLDVQGFELEVLRGADATVSDPALKVVQMEVSLIDINVGAPLMREVLDVMGEWGFDFYDLSSMIRRPIDRALWQVDALFVRRGSPLRASKRWG